MATTKEKFIQRYNEQKEQVMKSLDKALEEVLHNDAFDFEKGEDSYKDVYPIIAAVCEKTASDIIETSSYDHVRKEMRKETNKYKRQTWFRYV